MLVTFIAVLLLAGSADELKETYREAIAAYQRGEAPEMKAAALRLLERRPGSPTFIYLAAAAEAMSGESEAALRRLDRLADMGLAMRAGEEPAFADLGDDPKFQQLIRRFNHNAQPAGNAEIVLRLDDGHFIPESVVFDPVSGRYLVGSVRQRRIVAVEPDGAVRDFVSPGEHGLMSVMGMKLDAASRRLFVATAGGREAPGTPDELIGRSGIIVLDADSGELAATHLLPEDGRDHWLGDLLLHADRVWASDSRTGEIWCLDADSSTWHRVVAPGTLSSPQGLAAGLTSDRIYLADYTGGLWVLSIVDGTLQPVTVPDAVNVYGIDGLYRQDRSLIAIQNGHRPNRVVRFDLGPDGESISGQQVLAAALPQFDDPTLGTIVGSDFLFVANSHWPRFDAEKNLPAADTLSGPIVMKLSLEESP